MTLLSHHSGQGSHEAQSCQLMVASGSLSPEKQREEGLCICIGTWGHRSTFLSATRDFKNFKKEMKRNCWSRYYSSLVHAETQFCSLKWSNSKRAMAAVLTIYWRKSWLQHPSVMINFLPGKVMTGGFSLLLDDICMWNHFCRKCLHWCLP